jgi:D-alanine-D-alanine ligase
MKICVLQPSYEGSSCDYQHYDPPRDLSGLWPEHEFRHVFLRKISTFAQIQALCREGFDVYVNLCEGYRDSDVASVDVIHALEHFKVPFTGPSSAMYDPPKDLMKIAARSSGVACPASVVAVDGRGIDEAIARLRFPLFVKPADYGDSLGVDDGSLARDASELRRQVEVIGREYGRLLIEEYIAGRELTVLVCGTPDPGGAPIALAPIEFRFPAGTSFKTYDLKVRQFHPECNVPCTDPDLAARLKAAAAAVFRSFSGESYARMDFRVTDDGRIYFLEVNFTCSVLYPPGYQGSADYILQYDGLGQAGFLRLIVENALARARRRVRPYVVREHGGGYAMIAARPLRAGELVFKGEARAQRLVTRTHVERTWSAADREIFYRYAYPVGPEVFVLWDTDPAEWAPENHSCDPNTRFEGLDVVAARDIAEGEELTLDYAVCYDSRTIPFDCTCGSPRCRGRITGGRGLFGSPATLPG